MGFFPLLGFWLRFIFVYRFNWKKMDKEIRENEDVENYKNVVAGAIGTGVLLLAIILGYELSH